MSDIRAAYSDNPEEMLRSVVEGLRKHMWSGGFPVIVTEDSEDGHTAKVKAAVKIPRLGEDGKVTYDELPVFEGIPVRFAGAGGLTHTHAIKKDDEGWISFGSRSIAEWHKNGGVQQPEDFRAHALSDASFHPGARSDPRKLQGVSKDSSQVRTDDKKSVHDVSHQAVSTTRTGDDGNTALHQVNGQQLISKLTDALHLVTASGILNRKGGSEIQVLQQAISKVAPKIFMNC